ncbi:MAG: alpha/beta fold hydrolase [Daejeonella sp.]
MKKLLLFFLALNYFTVQAQTLKNYTQTADSCLSYLDKSGITTGILYDRVYPFAALAIFNENYADTSSYSHFIQGYNELYNAAYSNSGMLATESFDQQISGKLKAGIYPVSILNYKFNYLDTMSVEDNLITTSGLLMFDVANRPRSPYIERLLTLAAVLTDTITASAAYFELPSSFYLNNTGNVISTVDIDFGDGSGFHQLTIGQGISINYSSAGLKTLHYYINYASGPQVETYSTVYVNPSASYLMRSSGVTVNGASCNGIEHPVQMPVEADIDYQGYEESFPIKGEGLATIYYHNTDCDQIIKKPIIIIDGFDPGSKREAGKLVDENLIYKDAANNNKNFAVDMLDKGYDVIILDFKQYEKNGKSIDGGSDYIQRNAFTLVKLIQWVNQQKENNGEQLVVVGPSMGGLISRYALAYMEQNSMPHNTRLWVSFDSPHLGANIPIGDQWMLDYFGNILGVKSAKSSLDGTLNSPAAKEMLLHHYLANTEAPSPHWTRTSFMQELNSLGFPTQLRKVALINGSGNGTLQGSFGDLALHIAARPTNLTRVIVGVGVLLIPFRTLFMKVVKVVAQGAGVTIDVSKTINTHSWFTPGYNGRNQVFSGELFGFILKRKHYASTFSNSIGLDNSMGGYYDTQKIIAKKFEEGFAGTLSWFMKPKIYTIIPHILLYRPKVRSQ